MLSNRVRLLSICVRVLSIRGWLLSMGRAERLMFQPEAESSCLVYHHFCQFDIGV